MLALDVRAPIPDVCPHILRSVPLVVTPQLVVPLVRSPEVLLPGFPLTTLFAPYEVC